MATIASAFMGKMTLANGQDTCQKLPKLGASDIWGKLPWQVQTHRSPPVHDPWQ